MAEPYMPSNGSEGEGFFEHFCAHCTHDAAFRATDYEGDGALGCQILAAQLRGEQQKEWITDERGSRCTAFTTDPASPVRCDKTADMFALSSEHRG